jgi:signal transduction histidine kinase
MKQRVGDVVTAARKTSRLTHQLLSMEHVSQQSIKSEFQALDLVKLTQETLANLALRAQQQNVTLSLECKESQIELHGSETFLSEAIDNLIDNALVYGCPNGGKIDVEIKLDDTDVHLYVQDYGKGIDPELITKVLERFVHGPDTNGEGSGLGLSIAKTIVELHDGELELLSEGQGTRVHIKIPL